MIDYDVPDDVAFFSVHIIAAIGLSNAPVRQSHVEAYCRTHLLHHLYN